jgi:uncharacterized protein (TIGR03067 family)
LDGTGTPRIGGTLLFPFNHPPSEKMNMTTRFNLFGLTTLLLASITGCSDPNAASPSVKPSLQGRWSGFEEGRPDEKIVLVLETNRFVYWDAQTNEIGRGTFVANETVRPMQMDLTFEQILAPEYAGKVGLAIYELNGDEMKIAGSEPGSTVRPTNLAGGNGVRAFTFRRE